MALDFTQLYRALNPFVSDTGEVGFNQGTIRTDYFRDRFGPKQPEPEPAVFQPLTPEQELEQARRAGTYYTYAEQENIPAPPVDNQYLFSLGRQIRPMQADNITSALADAYGAQPTDFLSSLPDWMQSIVRPAFSPVLDALGTAYEGTANPNLTPVQPTKW